MTPEERLRELGHVLPPAPKSIANYVGSVRTGNLLFLSGKGPDLAGGRTWQGKLGADFTIEEGYTAARNTMLNLLAESIPADEVPRLNVNKATAIEFESRLSLKRSEAAAVIQYREKNGPFKSIADLKKVPGIDPAKIEAVLKETAEAEQLDLRQPGEAFSVLPTV